MKIEKKTLNEALKVLGKVVSQTSSVDVQKSIRFVGDANGGADVTGYDNFLCSKNTKFALFKFKNIQFSSSCPKNPMPLKRQKMAIITGIW